MTQKKGVRVVLQILLIAACVFMLGGFSTINTQAKAKSYTIQFNKNGGKGKMTSQKCTIGKSYKLKANKFTKKGYVFVGWNTQKNGKGKSYAEQKKVKNLSKKDGDKVTLYAQWKKGIKVKFNANSGTVATKSMLVVKGKKYGTYSKLPVASKTGYDFKGWYTKKKGGKKVTDKTKVTIKKTQTLYARYKIVDYSITYNLNGGVNGANPTSYRVTSDTITLAAPAKNGYIFEGWYTDLTYTTRIDTIQKGSTGNLTLYAKWKLAEYSITYNLNGGKNSYRNPDTYTCKDSITLRTPSQTGYTFDGWYTDSAYKNRITSIAQGTTGNLTLYAKWTIKTYQIGYYLDGGTNHPSNPSSYTVKTETITLQPATKEGYDFVKWTKYGFDGTTVTKISKGSTGSVTLYANFKPEEYDITYVLDGGENSPLNPDTYTCESYVAFRKPTKERHRFEGFYSDANFTNPVTTLRNNKGDITLYAKWEYIPVTKAEWVSDLVDTMGVSISANDLDQDMDGQPNYTFVDIKDHEAAMKIEAAAMYGLIPVERDEEGGAIYFDPDDAATREFIAASSAMALGFETEGIETPDCTDADAVTYKEYVTIAMNQEIIGKLEDGSFKPNNVLTEAERVAALAKIAEIKASAEGEVENKNDSTYVDGVKTINEGTTYSVSINGLPVVSANSVEADASQWTDETDIKVTLPANDETSALAEGSVVILPGNDVFLSGLALKVTAVEATETEVILTCKKPSGLSEVFETIDVSGVAVVDGSTVVGADGVEAVYNPNGSVGGDEGLDNAGLDVEDSFSMPGSISFTFKNKELCDGVNLNGKVEVSIPDISYRLNAGVNLWDGVYINDLYLAITEQIDFVGEIEAELHSGGYNDPGKIEIGRASFPLGPSGLTVDVVFWFNYEIGGSGSITCSIENTNGIQMKKGNLRVIKDMDADIQVNVEGHAEVGPKLSLMLTMFSVFDLVDLTADAGLGVTGSATSRTENSIADLSMTCYDIGAYLYLKVSAGENSIIGELLDLSWSWDIFDSETSPVKKMWHFEDTIEQPFHEVEECTFGNGRIQGSVMDAESNIKIPNATVKVYSTNGKLLKTLYTDALGKYSLELRAGEYKFVISARGYITYQDNYTVNVGQTTYLEASLMIDQAYVDVTESTASGKILNSVNGDEVQNAAINVRKGWNKKTGEVIQTLATDSNGNYELTLPLGNYTLEISKDGYVTCYLNIIVKATDTPDQNGELTPTHVEGGGILRVVLTWGEEPHDLDSHMLGPETDGEDRFHVYFSNRNYYNDNGNQVVNLDRDDVTSYGPETVTVYELNETGTYSYYIYDFTNGGSSSSTAMSESRAKIKVYDEGQLVTTFSVPYGEGGTCWHVFDYDAETRQVIPVNTMSYVSSSGSVGRAGDAFDGADDTLESKDLQTIANDLTEKE